MNQKYTVAKDMIVTIDFTLTLDDGEAVETTQEGMPLRYLAGHDQLLPALEAALNGLNPDDEISITLSPEEGYGEYDEDGLEEMPLDAFPADQTPEPGMAVGVQDEDGETYEAYVSEVRPDAIVLDYNHPLAGETLHFQVKVLDVRPATAEELAHGHAHDEDGHHHYS